MTRDDIIKLAQKCQLIGMRPHLDGIYQESLERFAALVIEATEPKRQIYEAYEKGREIGMLVEREECAKVCDDRAAEYEPGRWGAYQGEYMEACECADAIRARGEK